MQAAAVAAFGGWRESGSIVGGKQHELAGIGGKKKERQDQRGKFSFCVKKSPIYQGKQATILSRDRGCCLPLSVGGESGREALVCLTIKQW